jgi:hypothetical protein
MVGLAAIPVNIGCLLRRGKDMTDNVLRTVWSRVRSWFDQNADHLALHFIPDTDGAPVQPYAGYLRLWFAEGFLAKQKSWGNTHFPALHGGVSLAFAGNEPTTFTTLTRSPQSWTMPGARLDFPITPLVPFRGGMVEVEAALYQATVQGPLGIAVNLLGSLAPLMGPPLSVAAAIAGPVSEALSTVLEETGNQPVLGLHWAMISPGGGGNVLRPGHLVLMDISEPKLTGVPVILDGRLHLQVPKGSAVLPTGVDYLVLRVECRPDRDDWRFPELDALIRTAGDALIRGQQEAFASWRTEAISRAWNSLDLTPTDQKRVALLVQEELDGLKQFGIVPGPDRGIESIALQRLPAVDDERVASLTLDQLLAS